MKSVQAILLISLLALAIGAQVSAKKVDDGSTVESDETNQVVAFLQTLSKHISTHGIAHMRQVASTQFSKLSAAQKAMFMSESARVVARTHNDDGEAKPAGPGTDAPNDKKIRISFDWSKVDVRNFLAWLVKQDPGSGGLSDMTFNSAQKPKMSRAQLARRRRSRARLLRKLRHLHKLRELTTAGEHDGYYWYKVPVVGLLNSQSIVAACKKFHLQTVCSHASYNDGQCVLTRYVNNGWHLSYPPHYQESWMTGFSSTSTFTLPTPTVAGRCRTLVVHIAGAPTNSTASRRASLATSRISTCCVVIAVSSIALNKSDCQCRQSHVVQVPAASGAHPEAARLFLVYL